VLLLEFLTKYCGTIRLNGEEIEAQTISERLSSMSGHIEIALVPKNTIDIQNTSPTDQVIVYVKPWMLEKSNNELTFMGVWNKDVPMPLRYMVGTVSKETNRMYYMKLRGELQPANVCARCGRTLVNPVSKIIGIGPECGHHVGIEPSVFINKEQAEQKIKQLSEKFRSVKWEGWIPKTAILELRNYNSDT
jgi:hypothetical protein